MASSRKSRSKSTTSSRRRFSDEFKQEALALAEKLGISDGTSKSQLSHARKMLRELLTSPKGD